MSIKSEGLLKNIFLLVLLDYLIKIVNKTLNACTNCINYVMPLILGTQK